MPCPETNLPNRGNYIFLFGKCQSCKDEFWGLGSGFWEEGEGAERCWSCLGVEEDFFESVTFWDILGHFHRYRKVERWGNRLCGLAAHV